MAMMTNDHTTRRHAARAARERLLAEQADVRAKLEAASRAVASRDSRGDRKA